MGAPSLVIDRVSPIREMLPGALFVALRGQRHDVIVFSPMLSAMAPPPR